MFTTHLSHVAFFTVMCDKCGHVFTEFERIFHISVKLAFDMYQENVSFHSLATPLKYDNISQKTHFIFHFLILLETEIMIFLVDGNPV